jgi:hypothetical protein
VGVIFVFIGHLIFVGVALPLLSELPSIAKRLVVLGIMLASFALPYAAIAVPQKTFPMRAQQVADRAQIIVAAIEDAKARTGAYPERLSELSVPSRGFRYFRTAGMAHQSIYGGSEWVLFREFALLSVLVTLPDVTF